MPPLPEAGFSAAPASGVVPLTVVFTDTSTGTIAGREWNFGDTPGSVPLSHTYLATGTFGVLLTASNPAGAGTASGLITVTEQITPLLWADFEDLELGIDPWFWRDQAQDTTDRDDFETLWAGDSRTLGTQYTGSSTVYSHYAIPGWANWQDYEYSGRLKMDDADSGIGVVVYSRYPAYEEKVYILRRYAGTPDTESFHLAASGTSLAGDLQTGVTPQPGTWYRFRVQAVTGLDRVTLRAKVWAEGSAEPGDWQAEAYDASAGRVTAGAVGMRTAGAGSKYFDDLVVSPLPSYTTTTRAITYTYDPLYRLTGADYSSGESFAYGYDPVGNPVSACASRDRLSHRPHPHPDRHDCHHLRLRRGQPARLLL